MTAVHQFVPALLPRDATGDHTRALRDAFRAEGWESDLYVEAAHDDLWSEAIYFEEYRDRARPGDILLYQAATASPIGAFLLGRPEALVVDYHNITPAHFYEQWEPDTAAKVREGRLQVAVLAARAELGIADSSFNAGELQHFGCPTSVVVPIVTDRRQWGAPSDSDEAAILADLHGSGTVLLFVGRVSPNKAQHQLVETLWWYRKYHDPDARLHLVGPAVTPAYADAVSAFAAELGLEDAVLHGSDLSPSQLAAWYEDADVFVCLSDHEGFCIPLIEAMHFELPIVAFAAGAVPETLGGAGLLVQDKRPGTVAAAVARIRADPRLAALLVDAGATRLGAFDPTLVRRRFVEVVGSMASRLAEVGG